MNNVYIRGNSLTGKMCALLLDCNTLYSDKQNYKDEKSLQDVLSIKLSDLSPSELKTLNDKASVDNYIIHKKVGFLHNGEIYSTPTQEMIDDYLAKQNRVCKDFKFETEYDCINIVKYLSDFTSHVKVKSENEIPTSNCIEICTNIQVYSTNDTYEHVLFKKTDIEPYSYIYDCTKTSNIKRICSSFVEIFDKEEEAVKIPNYYTKPKMFVEYDFINNKFTCYIGRFATKTRIEQYHVIKACNIIKNLFKGDFER